MKPTALRRRYLVDPTMQYHVAFLLTGEVIVVCLLFMGFLYAINASYLTIIRQMAPEDSFAADSALYVHRVFTIAVPVVVLSVAGLLILLGVLMTNRIAGPIYRLRQWMQRVGEGEQPPPFQARSTDTVDPLVTSFNEMLAALGDRRQRAHTAVECLTRELQAACDEMPPESVFDHLQHMRSALDDLQALLSASAAEDHAGTAPEDQPEAETA